MATNQSKGMERPSKTYRQMSEHERKEFQAELFHAIIRSEECFEMAKKVVEYAKSNGVFDTTKFGTDDIFKS